MSKFNLEATYQVRSQKVVLVCRAISNCKSDVYSSAPFSNVLREAERWFSRLGDRSFPTMQSKSRSRAQEPCDRAMPQSFPITGLPLQFFARVYTPPPLGDKNEHYSAAVDEKSHEECAGTTHSSNRGVVRCCA